MKPFGHSCVQTNRRSISRRIARYIQSTTGDCRYWLTAWAPAVRHLARHSLASLQVCKYASMQESISHEDGSAKDTSLRVGRPMSHSALEESEQPPIFSCLDGSWTGLERTISGGPILPGCAVTSSNARLYELIATVLEVIGFSQTCPNIHDILVGTGNPGNLHREIPDAERAAFGETRASAWSTNWLTWALLSSSELVILHSL